MLKTIKVYKLFGIEVEMIKSTTLKKYLDGLLNTTDSNNAYRDVSQCFSSRGKKVPPLLFASVMTLQRGFGIIKGKEEIFEEYLRDRGYKLRDKKQQKEGDWGKIIERPEEEKPVMATPPTEDAEPASREDLVESLKAIKKLDSEEVLSLSTLRKKYRIPNKYISDMIAENGVPVVLTRGLRGQLGYEAGKVVKALEILLDFCEGNLA